MINSQVQKARLMFPKMADEIFDQWIASSIPILGWNFSSINQPIAGTKWESFFLFKPLFFWSNLEWKLKVIPINYDRYNIESSNRIRWIFEHCVSNQHTPTSKIKNTADRFWACTRYIKEYKKLPKPIVGISEGGALTIIDGHHRLAALCYLHVKFGKIPIYVGFYKR